MSLRWSWIWVELYFRILNILSFSGLFLTSYLEGTPPDSKKMTTQNNMYFIEN